MTAGGFGDVEISFCAKQIFAKRKGNKILR
jgi:hypothetical protein